MNEPMLRGNLERGGPQGALGRYALVLGLLAALLAVSAWRQGVRTPGEFWDMVLIVLLQVSINGILAIGVTFVLLTGGVDLSLGSLVALTGVVAAGFAHPGDWPLVVPVGMGVLAGLACGLTSGAVIVWGRVAPFIATLGMMTAARGLALVLSKGMPVSDLSGPFRALASGSAAGVHYPVLVLAAVAAMSWLFLRTMRYGRYVYAVGGNAEAARASGINVAGIKLFVYGLSGALAGLAGVLQAARISTGQPNAGEGFELNAIAAAVIGGTSLSGGVGTVGGALLGTVLIGAINDCMDLLGVPSYYQQIIKGCIIVAAVWLDRRRKDQ